MNARLEQALGGEGEFGYGSNLDDLELSVDELKGELSIETARVEVHMAQFVVFSVIIFDEVKRIESTQDIFGGLWSMLKSFAFTSQPFIPIRMYKKNNNICIVIVMNKSERKKCCETIQLYENTHPRTDILSKDGDSVFSTMSTDSTGISFRGIVLLMRSVSGEFFSSAFFPGPTEFRGGNFPSQNLEHSS